MSAESGISDATTSAQDASADGSHGSDAAGGEDAAGGKSDGGHADAGEAGAPPMDASSSSESGSSSSDSGSSGTPDAGIFASVTASAPPAWSGPKVNGTVSVNQTAVVGHLTQGFVGLSYEKSHLTDQFFTGNNAPLIVLCKLLGPSVVRVGGNSVDLTQWQASAPAAAVSAISSSIGTTDVDGLAAFLQATGWKAIYGVNLKSFLPANDAAEAKYASSKLGSNLSAIEIGNEPDLYKQTYATWSSDWAAVATAIRAAVPAVPLAGPATAGAASTRRPSSRTTRPAASRS